MIDLVQPGETEVSVMYVLENAKGSVYFDGILQSVVSDATVRTHEVLEDLKSRGVVSCDARNRWRLRNRPQVVAEVGGDPNFRRG